jgi:glycine oxidase
MSRPSELIVVGAGVVGCSIAYELARRGANVRVLDNRDPGQGATQASAGILAPHIEADVEGHFLDLTVRSLDMFDEFISGVSSASGRSIPYRRTGTLQVATDSDAMTMLRQSAARLTAHGVTHTVLDGPAAHAEEPQLGGEMAGALLVPIHGYVAAEELTGALAAAARHHGARLVESGRVRRIASSSGDLVVESDRGSLTANDVVLAAGSWSGQIEIVGVSSRIPVRPIRGQLLRLAWVGQPLRRVTWSERCYLVPWDEGTLLVGATTEDAGFEERPTAAGVRDLLDAVCELVPQAWRAVFVGARAGLRPATADGMPVIGRSRVLPNLMYATGHYRNGVMLAPVTARLVADALLADVIDPMMHALRPERFGEL